MTRYLVATASAATTEAACEYLNEKLDDDDSVYVLTVDVPDERDDSQAALDTAQVSLADVGEVRTIRRSGTPGREIVAFVRENEIEEIIMGPARGGGISTIGSTTREVLTNVDKPVFVLPADRP
ncbi:universal stress protein [Natronomonas marina]|jgi:nucleotide-binding universal stress UspA family protein|uniref:universal stress protein n=1 Tax=Natronomonas marina TaxID=2961939 RepID=UPI0020C9598E|nr:universal stress protein [Natronomonas marina]